jgi:hypothetical protein
MLGAPLSLVRVSAGDFVVLNSNDNMRVFGTACHVSRFSVTSLQTKRAPKTLFGEREYLISIVLVILCGAGASLVITAPTSQGIVRNLPPQRVSIFRDLPRVPETRGAVALATQRGRDRVSYL